MQSLNVMLVGDGKYAEQIKSSKYLKKLYTTSDANIKDAVSVNFNKFEELAKKCKILQIDLVIVENEKWILQGIGDILKKYFINTIAPTSYWTNLSLSNIFARNMCEQYGIKVPEKILVPIEYPIVIKADGFCQIAYSMDDILENISNLNTKSPEISKTVFTEQFIEGEELLIVSLFDGKHLLTFDNDDLVQQYSTNLENMLLSENADFVGFLNSKIIKSNGQIYNIGFDFKFIKPNIETDLLYILENALYQKLNEINVY